MRGESPWVTRAQENSLPSQAYAGNAAWERANDGWDADRRDVEEFASREMARTGIVTWDDRDGAEAFTKCR